MIIRAAIGNSSALKLEIPDVPMNLETPDTISTSRIIGGGSSISIFETSIAGERRSIEITLDSEKYKIIRQMQKLRSEWILTAQGRVFRVWINVLSAIPDRILRSRYGIELEFVFVKEESRC